MSDEIETKKPAPLEEGLSRRQLLMRSVAGAAAAGAAGFGAYAHHKTKGTPHDEKISNPWISVTCSGPLS